MKRRRFLSAVTVGTAGWLAAHEARGARSSHDDTRPVAAGQETAARVPAGDQVPKVTWSRRVPVRYEADVAVIGGGIAGVSAAAAAARSGARVVLIERFAVTGGVLTSGGVANFCDETQVRQPLGEVFAEIVADLDRWQAIGHPASAWLRAVQSVRTQ
jgi:NADPH-dependent glutamate synthase beta subunit-like oxidoreductase